MNLKYKLSILAVLLISASSCDKDFEQININPLAAQAMDPNFQLANIQYQLALNTLPYDSEIVQQVITPYGGVHAGANLNVLSENNNSSKWNALYNGPIKNSVDVIAKTSTDAARVSLYNITRIMKAYSFMVLVDAYGDAPYTEAGKGYLENNFLPKYDNQETIYADLLTEVEDATNKLDATKDIIAQDLFYKGNIPQWKRFGNSLLLRLGMRYSKVDPAKAQQTVAKAVDPARGGVFASNTDNAIIVFNTLYPNGTSGGLIGAERGNFYAPAPFINYLKEKNDPRIGVLFAKYEFPARALGLTGAESTALADQFGLPYGYDDGSITTAPGFRGRATGGGFNYSQLNRRTVLKADAPGFILTYAQTSLLLAEAAVRGWGPTGTATSYYTAGIKGHMDQLRSYDPTFGVIAPAAQDAYVNSAAIVLSAAQATALQQINEQYWVASFLDGSEAWANFRRSGYPLLAPNRYNGRDASLDLPSAAGFIRRLYYPINEKAVNKVNADAAIARQGGDNFSVRIFWDKQ